MLLLKFDLKKIRSGLEPGAYSLREIRLYFDNVPTGGKSQNRKTEQSDWLISNFGLKIQPIRNRLT